eukprot:CAMPEP_0176007030 /NCGR_PEP_ID=MMETSP0120_2-20121206/3023_1 /TAXON_ID=160619 /ORGANISM="Kryptoperidinium foliaceum, Strain CCMP 1326" /LENGTH=159 /DNA_ID=CAMNT_0017339779 /DNA_START=232 /DNA_END=708 /DNA_ORIENTATION=+
MTNTPLSGNRSTRATGVLATSCSTRDGDHRNDGSAAIVRAFQQQRHVARDVVSRRPRDVEIAVDTEGLHQGPGAQRWLDVADGPEEAGRQWHREVAGLGATHSPTRVCHRSVATPGAQLKLVGGPAADAVEPCAENAREVPLAALFRFPHYRRHAIEIL